MNRSLALGLLVGLAVGLVAGALIARSRNPETPREFPPPPAAPPPPVAPKETSSDLEVAVLRAQVAELVTKLAEKTRAESAPAKDPADADGEPDKAAWKTKLEALLKQGAVAYKGEAFRAMVADLKKRGAAGIEALADKLLNAESGGERFLAAALMEELDDPAAIPALAQALAKDDDLLVRRMSSHALAVIENEAGLASLRAAMGSDSDWGVRVNSAYGVAKLGQADGLKMLEDAYKSPATPAEHKLAVLGGLADVAAPSSAPIFRKILAESTDITYLYISIAAVQKMKDTASLTELNRIVSDPKYSANIREMAKKAAEALAN